MATLPSELRDLVQGGPMAHVTTLNADGSPQVSVVWVGLDGDDIVSGHMQRRLKVRNVERDPRVVLSVEGTGLNSYGLKEYLVVHGRARVEPGGAAALLQRLAHVYLGPDVVFPAPNLPAEAGYVLRITPERFGGVGPWAA
jgi:PPOX class probable F420-dependent enzyme